MIELFTNGVVINILIGFFYSALLGIIIFILTNINEKQKNTKELEIDLTKYTFISNSINISLTNIAQIDGAEYRRFFADIFDGKSVRINQYNNVKEVILFDKIAYLPTINEYLIINFIDKVENDLNEEKIEALLNVLTKTKKEKEKYINEYNLFLVRYEDINRRIRRLNEMLDYYRTLSENIIKLELNYQNKQMFERQMKIFKYCTDSLIGEAKNILAQLKLLDDALISNKQAIKVELKDLNNCYKAIFKVLIIALIVCTLALLIA